MQQEVSSLGRLPWPAVGLAALVWLMSVAYGFQYIVMGNEAAHLAYFRMATIPYVAVVALLAWHAVRARPVGWDVTHIPTGAGLAMMALSWVLTSYFYSPQLAPLPWVLVAVAVPAAAWVANWRGGAQGSVMVFLASWLGVIAYLTSRLPHDVAGGDMLQIIDFAVRDLLAGNSPYKPYFTVSGKEVLFAYWPGVWLPYLPVIALGFDMRVLNVGLLSLLILVFWRVAGGGERGATTLAVVLMPVLLSPPFLQMALSGHLWLYWLLATLTLLSVVHGKYILAAVMFGLCLASRPTALFMAGPIVAYVWTRAGARTALTGGGLAILTFLALNAPFYLLYKDAFVRASFGVYVGFGQVLTHFSIEGILQAFGFGALGKPLQVFVALASTSVIVLKKDLAGERFIAMTGVTYILEILFASYATRYMYFTGFLLVALGLVLGQANRQKRLRHTVRPPAVSESA